MAAKKRTKKKAAIAVPPLLNRVMAILGGPGRSLGLMLLAVAILGVTTFVLWRKVRDDLLASDEYQVGVEDIEITPLPQWIRRTDVRGKVFQYIGPLSIMDDAAAQRVADAFRLQPWVERVIKVSKHHPARIRVDLKYRRPVCLVQVSAFDAIAVDARGVCLPSDDFDPVVLNESVPYPIVVGVTSTPGAGVGDCWCDERVVGAAEIANAFGETWQELNLDRIEPMQQVRRKSRAEYSYDLITSQGTRVVWGRSPRTKYSKEVPAETKIDRLRRYVAVHGSLEGSRGPQKIDVSRPDGLKTLGELRAAREAIDAQRRR